MPRPMLVAALLALLLAACGQDPIGGGAPVGSGHADVPPPLPAGPAAYEVAGSVALPRVAPEDHHDLHNVFHLSERVISGSEPHGEEAIRRIAAMGVKTILSVDGAVPDAETAAKYGMRYVHVPIQYRGITREELLQIAKTFRELPGPFFVHCFHGKHRGPAAAALGRVLLDGASREQAVAEMRQWCGTSPKYAGLYEVIARGDLPSVATTSAYAFDFPAAHSYRGFRHLMIELARAFDNVTYASKRSWAPDPEHPDLDARNESAKLLDLLAKSLALPDERPGDFQAWLRESTEAAATLREALQDGAHEAAGRALEAVRQRCEACHAAYRND
jgi:protein tyrosine phosphatase (PTP) superfamily phosphohydrolase (DUF442 family)